MSTFIDYTQYRLFSFCEWAWYERYVRQVVREPFAVGPSGKDDPLTLGSLVHAGLERYRKEGRYDFDPGLIARLDASHECASWARLLLSCYVQRYPAEQFKLFRCEQPTYFDLGMPEIRGMAKIDYWFEVDQLTELDSGLGGFGTNFVLEPGLWIREYKTFAAGRDRGLFLESWRVNMQADFQIHALERSLGRPVNGIFVDVLEKPQPYVPKRRCKGCDQLQRLADWIPAGDQGACPGCGNVQKIDTADKSKKERRPDFYRYKITRTPEQLRWSLDEIKRAARRMEELRSNKAAGVTLGGGWFWDGPHRSSERCIATVRGVSQRCEYFEPHAALRSAVGWPGFVMANTLEYAAASEEEHERT